MSNKLLPSYLLILQVMNMQPGLGLPGVMNCEGSPDSRVGPT